MDISQQQQQKKRCKRNFKVHSFQVGSECFLFGITDQHASGNDNAFAPGPHLSCDPWSLGINTPHCTHRDCAEAATSLSSHFGCHSLWQRACFLSPMKMQEELSAELMGHHARNRWLTIFCPTCPSSCSKGSSMTMRAPKPRAAPSPGTMRPQLQSRQSGGLFNSAWRCFLEQRTLLTPRNKVLPILMHFPQPFQNREGRHFIIVNDFLSSAVLKVTGLQRSWELKTVVPEHSLLAPFPGMWQQVTTLMGPTASCFLSNL